MGFLDGITFWFGKLVAELLWGAFWILALIVVLGLLVWRQDVAAAKRRSEQEKHGHPWKY